MTLDKAMDVLRYLLDYCNEEEQEALKIALEIIWSVKLKDD